MLVSNLCLCSPLAQHAHGANVGADSADQHGPAAQVDLQAGLEEEEAAALGAAHDRDDGRHRDERKDARDGACAQYFVRHAISAWAQTCACAAARVRRASLGATR